MRKFSYISKDSEDKSEEYNISDDLDEQVSHQVGTGYSMRSVRNTRGRMTPGPMPGPGGNPQGLHSHGNTGNVWYGLGNVTQQNVSPHTHQVNSGEGGHHDSHQTGHSHNTSVGGYGSNQQHVHQVHSYHEHPDPNWVEQMGLYGTGPHNHPDGSHTGGVTWSGDQSLGNPSSVVSHRHYNPNNSTHAHGGGNATRGGGGNRQRQPMRRAARRQTQTRTSNRPPVRRGRY